MLDQFWAANHYVAGAYDTMVSVKACSTRLKPLLTDWVRDAEPGDGGRGERPQQQTLLPRPASQRLQTRHQHAQGTFTLPVPVVPVVPVPVPVPVPPLYLYWCT